MKGNRLWTLVKAAIIGGSLLFSLASEAVCQQQETAEQFIERVKKALKNDEWGRAQSGIRQALALKPDSAEANLLAAQVYWHEGARSMAIDSLTKAIESQPIFPEAHFLLAQCLKESHMLLNLAQPRYTEEARALKIQGTVSMGLLVTENGDVDSVLVFRGLGHGLDEQATEVARKLKFSPATRSGKPIPYLKKVSVEFNLK